MSDVGSPASCWCLSSLSSPRQMQVMVDLISYLIREPAELFECVE